MGYCKMCWRAKVRLRRQTYGKEAIRAYEKQRALNPVRRARQQTYRRNWETNYPDRKRESRQKYKRLSKQLGRGDFSPKGKLARNAYTMRRYRTDTNFRLAHSLRSRTRLAIKTLKTGSAIRDLGCTIPELRKYLEARFRAGMTWQNWGTNGWHLDHIRPLSKFDLSDRGQYLEAVNYKNLHPLWAEENLRKANL